VSFDPTRRSTQVPGSKAVFDSIANQKKSAHHAPTTLAFSGSNLPAQSVAELFLGQISYRYVSCLRVLDFDSIAIAHTLHLGPTAVRHRDLIVRMRAVSWTAAGVQERFRQVSEPSERPWLPVGSSR
jgi:hypothetical protein